MEKSAGSTWLDNGKEKEGENGKEKEERRKKGEEAGMEGIVKGTY